MAAQPAQSLLHSSDVTPSFKSLLLLLPPHIWGVYSSHLATKRKQTRLFSPHTTQFCPAKANPFLPEGLLYVCSHYLESLFKVMVERSGGQGFLKYMLVTRMGTLKPARVETLFLVAVLFTRDVMIIRIRQSEPAYFILQKLQQILFTRKPFLSLANFGTASVTHIPATLISAIKLCWIFMQSG